MQQCHEQKPGTGWCCLRRAYHPGPHYSDLVGLWGETPDDTDDQHLDQLYDRDYRLLNRNYGLAMHRALRAQWPAVYNDWNDPCLLETYLYGA